MNWEEKEGMPHAQIDGTTLRIKTQCIYYSYGTHIWLVLESFSKNRWKELHYITSKYPDVSEKSKNIPAEQVTERLKQYAEYLYNGQKKEFKVQTFNELVKISAINWQQAKEIAENDGHHVMEIYLEDRQVYWR